MSRSSLNMKVSVYEKVDDARDGWERTSKQKRAAIVCLLLVATATAFALGFVLQDLSRFTKTSSSTTPQPPPENTVYDSCDNYGTGAGVGPWEYDGLSCAACSDNLGQIYLAECNHTCSDWVIKPKTAGIDPVLDTCEVPPYIPPPPDYNPDELCTEGYYKTYENLGCKTNNFYDVLLLTEECEFCDSDSTNVTKEMCVAECEKRPNCLGYMISPYGANKCYLVTKKIKHLCQNYDETSVFCKKEAESLHCYYDPTDYVTYGGAKQACAIKGPGWTLSGGKDLEQVYRAQNECKTDKGCWVEYEDPKCYYVNEYQRYDGEHDGGSCGEPRGYCCDEPTDHPTVSPTHSPTKTKYFVVQEKMPYEDAVAECKKYGAQLATAHSQDDQDFLWDVCKAGIDPFGNDCGCWIGYDRIGLPPLTSNFNWIDDSPTDYTNWEKGGEYGDQPNNYNDRNEACVHVRPFSKGGWNDLPCSGECDAYDTKPYPLCMYKYTDRPTYSPSVEPTESPSKKPTYYPTKKPTNYPTTKEPTYYPTTGEPTRYPTKPTNYPTTESPTYYPTTSKPTPYPTTGKPTYYPTTQKPTPYPTTARPTYHPTTRKPTPYPTTGKPTYYPTTKKPTPYPTTGKPTYYPTTKKPTPYPTTAQPTYYPTTKKPTPYPTTAKPTPYPTTGKPTEYPTTSKPTYHPTTRKPTEYPTTKKPTPYPTTGKPTEYPTTGKPTYHPTTRKPTPYPTTGKPTEYPTTSKPTYHPTTRKPTEYPTTAKPTPYPTTGKPTEYPTTRKPTPYPTTGKPTEYPTTSRPTYHPTTRKPTEYPTTAKPTPYPTTPKPSEYPTTARPTYFPTTKKPTPYPTTARPTYYPTTKKPTPYPTTARPTYYPTTKKPTPYPTTAKPTEYPTTSRPTYQPTTRKPTEYPTTLKPTPYPTTRKPTPYPTTAKPTPYPTTRKPTPYPTTGKPTEYPTTYRPTYQPTTRKPTEYPTTRKPTPHPTTGKPTEYPTTKMPTPYPTTRKPTPYPTTRKPTPYPTTEKPTDYPTTYRPTYQPTTRKPTEYPTTRKPTPYPTTGRPTYFPSSRKPTPYPTTKKPTPYPTTKYPTNYPTTKKPTPYPTTRKPTPYPTTKYPTNYPTTRKPTPYPTTKQPTNYPTKKPDSYPYCYWKNGEGMWKADNDHNYKVHLKYLYERTPLVNYVYDSDYYPCCSYYSQYCNGPTYEIDTHTSSYYLAPADKIKWWLKEKCNSENCAYDSDRHKTLKCKCADTVYFADNYDSYPTGMLTGGNFYNKWEPKETPIIRDRNSFQKPSDKVCSKPDGKCLDVYGKLYSQKIEYKFSGEWKDKDNVARNYRKHVDRYCTLSFKMAGHKRCGKKHYSSATEATNAGCIDYHKDESFEKYYETKAKMVLKDKSSQLAESVWNVEWKQDYQLYGLTGDVYDYDDYFYVYFYGHGYKWYNGNKGYYDHAANFIDDAEVTCCCVEKFDKYVYKTVVNYQGKTKKGDPVPFDKSKPDSILNKPANYDYFNNDYNPGHVAENSQLYSLGINGNVIYKFDSGFYEKLYIYEETVIKCTSYDSCSYQDSNEDAKVEVSADGISWLVIAESLNALQAWQLYSEDSDSRRRLLADGDAPAEGDDSLPNVTDGSDLGGEEDGEFYFNNYQFKSFGAVTSNSRTNTHYYKKIKYVKLWLPNNACFKYVRVTDKSVGYNDADDGFDLHAIKTSKVCCNDKDNDYLYATPPPTTPEPYTTSALEIATDLGIRTGSTVMFIVAVVGTVSLLGLVGLSVSLLRRKKAFRKRSIMEVEMKDMDELEAKEREVQKQERRVSKARRLSGLADENVAPAPRPSSTPKAVKARKVEDSDGLVGLNL